MRLFVHNHVVQGSCCSLIDPIKRRNLRLHMPQNRFLNRNRRCGNCSTPRKTGYDPKRKTPKSAQHEAAAPALAASFKFRAKQGTMPPFMGEKSIKLGQHVWHAPARNPTLGQIDADRPLLSSMINLHDPVAE